MPFNKLLFKSLCFLPHPNPVNLILMGTTVHKTCSSKLTGRQVFLLQGTLPTMPPYHPVTFDHAMIQFLIRIQTMFLGTSVTIIPAIVEEIPFAQAAFASIVIMEGNIGTNTSLPTMAVGWAPPITSVSYDLLNRQIKCIQLIIYTVRQDYGFMSGTCCRMTVRDYAAISICRIMNLVRKFAPGTGAGHKRCIRVATADMGLIGDLTGALAFPEISVPFFIIF